MMLFDLNEPMPQFIDRFLTRTAVGLLLIALAQGSAIAFALLNEGSAWRGPLDLAELALGVATLIAVLPAFVALMIRRSRGQEACMADGFIADAFRRAGSAAFTCTFLGLVIARMSAHRLPDAWTTDVVLRALLAIALGAFAIAFFRRVGMFDRAAKD